MAIVGGAAIAGTASIVGSSIAASGARSAASAQERAALESAQVQREALGFNREVYETGREDLRPYRTAGTSALNALSDLFLPGGAQSVNRMGVEQGHLETARRNRLAAEQRAGTKDASSAQGDTAADWMRQAEQWRGIEDMWSGQINRLSSAPPAANGNAPDYSAFFKSPGYNFRLNEGTKARDRSAAARGRLLSGAQDLELLRYGQGFASEEFNNYANRLAQIAGSGQNAAGSSTQFGLQAAGQGGQISANIGQGIQNAGLANASGIVGSANAINQGLGNLAFLGQQGFNFGTANNNINWMSPRIVNTNPSGITTARIAA